MKKRIISILLIVAIILTASLALGGCAKKDANFPVTIGHTEISQKPEKVAVLSDNLADIIIYMDEFEAQICAISDSCTQPELTKYIESVGSETNPSVDALVRSGAQYVLTDTPLSDTILDKLQNNDITVLTLMVPQNAEQLATVYRTLGTFFGGKADGKISGEGAYTRLMDVLNSAGKKNSDANTTALCYLYLNEDGRLCALNGKSGYTGMVLDYVCISNLNTGIFGPDENETSCIVNTTSLKIANPTYILYDTPEVLTTLESLGLGELAAITNGNALQIPKAQLECFGKSMIDTQKTIIDFIYGNTADTPTTPADSSCAAQYGIDITKDTIYKLHDQDLEEIRIIQQRLVDLEYLDLEGDEPTTYFGQKTETAVRDFQTANGLEVTGIVTKTTLEKLFLTSTLTKSGNVFDPNAQPEPEPEPDDTDTPEDTDSPEIDSNITQSYNIDLSVEKSYGFGNNADDIKAIQQRLFDLGYLYPDEETIEPTSYYVNDSKNAFLAFENANGLQHADGYAEYDELILLFSENIV